MHNLTGQCHLKFVGKKQVAKRACNVGFLHMKLWSSVN